METVVCLERGGIMCSIGKREFYLDPRKSVNTGTVFVSHAHTDHLPPSGTPAISSDETRKLTALRGVTIGTAEHDGVTLVDSGHILGSCGLLVDDVFYTGDICTRTRAFMRGARVPKCNTLITECTFGLDKFSFPDMASTAHRVNQIIAEIFSRGKPVILLGYQIGKAQILTHMFGGWEPFYVHDSVKLINDAYRNMGVNLRDAMSHTEAESRGLLARGPWVMVAPMAGPKNGKFVSEMASKYGAVTVGFSGWAGSRNAAQRSADYVIPMSDHCDFDELVSMVVSSGAKKVYTTHGYADEFSAHLQSMGIDAQALA